MTAKPWEARARMFAGPNGSGKSTVQRNIGSTQQPWFFGQVVNPDEIEASVKRDGWFDLAPFGIEATVDEVRSAFAASAFLQSVGLAPQASSINGEGKRLDFSALPFNSYHASVLADWMRHRFLAEEVSFTFETVMSDPGKVGFLQQAKDGGFRTYLYFVSTEDPAINIARVALRVSQGGHDVPRDKIVSRYTRSLELAREALRHTSRAFFFDTSDAEPLLVGESENGARPERRGDLVPAWFKTYVLDRI
ncbi:MAG: hypothetical protein K2W96_21090 [Gemmataceae bacterium]|nr:hypothetical protein [Gemmataceae bacterium]